MARRPDNATPPRRGLSRRAFLGGAGAVVALPFLESLLPRGLSRAARAAEAPSRRRLLYMYVPCGIHMADWRPASAGAGYALSPTLAPLAPVKDQLLVLSGLSNKPSRPDGAGDHAAGTGGFLTCHHVVKTEGDDIENAISVDQVAANAIGGQTRLPSLQLGLEGGDSVGGCDSGYSCSYARNISWTGPKTPLPKITRPRQVFDRLFAGFDPRDTAEERARRKLQRKSVLDYVTGEANALSARVGKSDKQKLDEYLTGVRELERSIDAADLSACLPPDYPPRDLENVDVHARLMVDLVAVAMSCDITRVVSFMLANAGSNRAYTWLDPTVTDGHHDISHHGGNAENFRKLAIINRWEVSVFGYLVERLAALEDAPGESVLDNALCYFSSEISDGDAHSHTDMPVLLAGRGGGAVAPGRHVVYTQEEPIADLFTSMLGSVGVDVPSFGDDGRGPLAGLTT